MRARLQDLAEARSSLQNLQDIYQATQSQLFRMATANEEEKAARQSEVRLPLVRLLPPASAAAAPPAVAQLPLVLVCTGGARPG